jgi:NAD-dependent DNA ligase
MSAKINKLVATLRKASDAYYNGTGEILGDEEYDRMRDELEQLDPKNPFLKEIGAPVPKGQAVLLPHKMASLNKIKPGTGAVDSFRMNSKVKSWVLSDKLDGISVLWDTGKRKLYLRGDGLTGVDVSQYALYLNGLNPRGFNQKWVLRGELVLPNNVSVEGALLPRSWVNGQLHQKTPIPEQLGKINFVAYELIEPSGLTREEQFRRMAEAGFEVPWNMIVNSITDEVLSAALLTRRSLCPYAMDGVVVGENSIPLKDSLETVTNPKDMRAFKMPLGDQQAETDVVDILWSASYQGYWIPRLQITPVLVGGSRIEYLTGHNARFVLDNQVGKGARIIIRKSGDVIPTLDKVLQPSADIVLPKGVWEGPEDTAAHLKVSEEDEENEDVILKKLEHFAKSLDIPHLGPGLCVKLISASIVTAGDLLKVSYSDLAKAIGDGMAKKVFPTIQTQLTKATEMDLMVASGMMPRGIGASKLKTLFAQNQDPRQWSTKIQSCEGWSTSALQSFYTKLPAYEQWRKSEIPAVPYPKMVVTKPVPVAVPVAKQIVCFTGFRSAELQAKLEAKGHEVTATFSKKTTILVVPDETTLNSNTEKIKKARENSTRILTRDQLIQEYL